MSIQCWDYIMASPALNYKCFDSPIEKVVTFPSTASMQKSTFTVQTEFHCVKSDSETHH